LIAGTSLAEDAAMLRKLLLGAALVGVVGVVAIATCGHRGQRGHTTTARDATIATPSRGPWNDRRDRVPPPAGHIPAWQVAPPEPHRDPAPAPRAPARLEVVVDDPSRIVDGDRPSRPIPGITTAAEETP
jgi:hypothetical protein